MTDEELAEQVAAAVDARMAQRIADAERRREDCQADRSRRAARRLPSPKPASALSAS